MISDGLKELPGSAPRLILATANPDKAAEIIAIVGSAIQLMPRPPCLTDVEETGATLWENALLKAAAVSEATGLPAIADDTALEVNALGGAPGLRSARFAGPGASYAANVAKLLRALDGVAGDQRLARVRTVALAHFPTGVQLVGEGMVEGAIAEAPRGFGGFGYDSVFIPLEGDGRTLAEMTVDEKHVLFSRGRAFRALITRLAYEFPSFWVLWRTCGWRLGYFSCGRASSIGPQPSMISACKAGTLWNPRARRMINLIFAFSASARAFDNPKRTASKIPSRCARIVRPNFTNSAIRLRDARDKTGPTTHRPPRHPDHQQRPPATPPSTDIPARSPHQPAPPHTTPAPATQSNSQAVSATPSARP